MKISIRMSLLSLLFLGLTSVVQAGSNPTVQDTPIVSVESATKPAARFSWKGKKAAGVFALGFYEINSDFESLYYNFPINSTRAAGFGFGGSFEFGVAERFSIEGSVAFSRLTWASHQRSIIKENFVAVDIVGHYHFLNNEKFDTYAIFGAGVYASSGTAAPLVDVGIGNYFKINESIAIKAELIFKSAIIFNRAEGRVGAVFTF